MKKDIILLIAGFAALYWLSKNLKPAQPVTLKARYDGGYGDAPQVITDRNLSSDLPGGGEVIWL